jgi:hypothetical protein
VDRLNVAMALQATPELSLYSGRDIGIDVNRLAYFRDEHFLACLGSPVDEPERWAGLESPRELRRAGAALPHGRNAVPGRHGARNNCLHGFRVAKQLISSDHPGRSD